MRPMFRWFVRLVAAASACGALPAVAADAIEDTPLVYAAASLTDVLQQVGADYERDRQQRVRFSFGSSATLARQIESGARADLFVSADQEWMDYVAQRDLIQRGSRLDLVGNRLVLVAPADSGVQLALTPGVSLAAALGPQGRLALADPASVPAGKYARAALTRLGAWSDVESRYVAAENVRMALLFVARGEAPLGIVYRTDALAEPRVRIVAEFPVDSHPAIVYPAALVAGARTGSGVFLEYLAGPAARARFQAAGFILLAGDRDPALACRAGERDLGQEIELFQGSGSPVVAAKSAADVLPELATGRLWSLQLAPQPAVRFAAPPSRRLLADGAFAGLARFEVATAGHYRVTVDGPFWIDVLRAGRPLTSIDFGGRHDCPLFRKSIEYDLPARERLVLQLGGAARSQARVTIVPVARR